MSKDTKNKIAVIGLGAQGLVAVKNLLERGFQVTGYDRNDYVGGLWRYNPEAVVSCLPTTRVNVSRERACFTDFPFPDETSSHPNGGQVDQYLNDYATHFKLWPHLRLGKTVEGIKRDDGEDRWILTVKSKDGAAETVPYGRIVVAAGPQSRPIRPSIPGEELFAGEVIHSVAFKDPTKFKDKTVVVLGSANTAADTSTGLLGIAKKIYLSHRAGSIMLPRILNNGAALDHGASYRMLGFRDLLDTYTPRLAALFMQKWINSIQDTHYNLRPEWRLNTPTPALEKRNPTVSDTLYPALRDGNITSIHNITRFTGPSTIELEDGSALRDIDTVILCTGYSLDLSWLGRHDPTLLHPHDPSSTARNTSAPRLYNNILSHTHPSSLAFIGLSLIFFPAFVVADLASAALASLWRDPTLLPSPTETARQYREHLAWRARIAAMPNDVGKGPPALQLANGPFMAWVQRIAGTRVDEHMSYCSWAAWRFWWRDPELARLLMDGVASPFMYRLFENGGQGRRTWEGARDAILKLNVECERSRKRAMQLPVDAAAAAGS